MQGRVIFGVAVVAAALLLSPSVSTSKECRLRVRAWWGGWRCADGEPDIERWVAPKPYGDPAYEVPVAPPVREPRAVTIEADIEIFDRGWNRTGYGRIGKDGRIDLFDAKSNRLGYGRVDQYGNVDLYDAKSNRIRPGAIHTLRPRKK